MKDTMGTFHHNNKRGQRMVKHSSGIKRYMPGLDGLRALSVMAVIAYHFNFKWASGGLLGVGVFFVLSGYLITDQLITQWKRNRRLDLKEFWIRRARRLLPAMFTMLAFVAIWLILFDKSRFIALKADFLSAALYFNNWWLIFHKVSYFESFGPPSPIGHLWSLAVEEQFYLIWPLVLIILLRIVPQRGKVFLLTLVGAAASVLAMAMIYVPGMDPSRVYYGTDTRVFAMLIGAALAIVLPSQNITANISRRSRNFLDLAGGIGLFIIILMIWRTNEYGDYLYYGGLMFFSIISAIVVAVLVHPASRLARLMGYGPLRWIGVRSYSLYIWHYPVIILTSPTIETNSSGIIRIFFQIVASLLLAALSWKYIEEPIRNGLLGKIWGKMNMNPKLIYRQLLIIVTLSPLIFLSVSCSNKVDSSVSVKATSETAVQNMKDQSDTSLHSNEESINTLPELPKVPIPKDQIMNTPITKEESDKGVTAIGDSVILDAAPFLEKKLPRIVIDGKVGRQMSQAQEVVDQLKANGKLGSRVIIELGTNGPFNSKELRKLLTSLGEVQQIVLVNTRVPKKWQDTVNSALKEVSADYQNATLVDWYSSSQGKDDYFSKDGVHLNQEGAKFYAELVAKGIQQ
ncbi:acyltransferase family protein [Paenibacillus sp. LMG 31458]|uniref:Acyltransferase family protein n=1 Tax=Paenibacillus phytorum TaxID=2654977 RepID=A0ABX1XS09_9BACL|nr:acyltransferase family protein [Paenibacillus phytorum]NOU71313.1 acyltransferase family protein [Paenibacillus phytorum]